MKPKQNANDAYLRLVGKVLSGETTRSEADLSTNFARVLEAIGLATVVDTRQTSSKRPDILAYRNIHEADFALAAEVVIESKKPAELKGTSLSDAAIGTLWTDKTVPYIKENLANIRYFVLTTFVDFFFLPITKEFRKDFQRDSSLLESDNALKERVKAVGQTLSLASLNVDPSEGRNWINWLTSHFSPENLSPAPLSEVRNTISVVSANQLELFAETLAALMSGIGGGHESTTGLFAAVRDAMPQSFETLDAETKRDLRLFTLAANPYTETLAAEKILKEHFLHWRNEFVAASIHSVISRLFTLKLIEDVYCVDHPQPLIEPKFWVLNFRSDEQPSEDLGPWVSGKVRALKDSKTPVIKHLAVFGAFFDWIWLHLDAALFNTLFRLFVSHDFSKLDHDLLGRFFEVYSQAVNRKQRQELGQYYTPVEVVHFMWKLAMTFVPKTVEPDALTVLDPAMGSGTFLKVGAAWLAKSGGPFWERLVGFDISAQVMGIAQANVFMAVLRELDASEANAVESLRLYTTDSLDPRNGKFLQTIAPLFEDETHRAYLEQAVKVSARVKQTEHFCLAIGNPPYRNNSRLTLAEVAGRFPRLLRSSAKASGAKKRNIRDDYAWFFAAADYFITGQGLICLITSDSYTRISSYRLLREELLKVYHIEALVNLGKGIFQDVGPNLGFCIIVLRKRDSFIKNLAKSVLEVPYYDLSSLIEAADTKIHGTSEDPRFMFMATFSRGSGSVDFKHHRPSAVHGYSLQPINSPTLVNAVLTNSVPTYNTKAKRLFLKKWPGIITSFDGFFRASSRTDLLSKVSSFYALARARNARGPVLRGKIATWAREHEMSEDIIRLESLAEQIASQRLDFDDSKIKRSNFGTIPNEVHWYPPSNHQCYLYFEPKLHIERNKHEGKAQGWGSMEQWRDPASHLIVPKLVFTTSTNPKAAYKAFVLGSDWYVKVHGGLSQQYHYTGLDNPMSSKRLDSIPNNLANEGETLYGILKDWGTGEDALLYYIAAIYNSDLAQDFIDERPGRDIQIRIPTGSQKDLTVAIIKFAQQLQWMHFALVELGGLKSINKSDLPLVIDSSLQRELGIQADSSVMRGYRSSVKYSLATDFELATQGACNEIQAILNKNIYKLYQVPTNQH